MENFSIKDYKPSKKRAIEIRQKTSRFANFRTSLISVMSEHNNPMMNDSIPDIPNDATVEQIIEATRLREIQERKLKQKIKPLKTELKEDPHSSIRHVSLHGLGSYVCWLYIFIFVFSFINIFFCKLVFVSSDMSNLKIQPKKNKKK